MHQTSSVTSVGAPNVGVTVIGSGRSRGTRAPVSGAWEEPRAGLERRHGELALVALTAERGDAGGDAVGQRRARQRADGREQLRVVELHPAWHGRLAEADQPLGL